MLIDGGLAGYAATVHNYVDARLTALGIPLDHILVSHYDVDHSGGIKALLIADNLYHVCDAIAGPVAITAVHGANRQERIACGAAAAVCVVLGGYAIPGGADHSVQVAIIRAALFINALGFPALDAAAAQRGIDEAEQGVALPLNPLLVQTAYRRRTIARRAGLAAADAIALGHNVRNAVRDAIFDAMSGGVAAGAQFQTGGRYAATHVIDIGNTAHIMADYAAAVQGQFSMDANYAVAAPGINRQRTSLTVGNLGDEVLWNTGPAAVVAAGNAPAVFVVSCLKFVWNAPLLAVPINSGQADNDDSIGLIVRFNQFFYYAGGDLPRQGEELIAASIMGTGLPNAAGGGALALPHRIACFKCGHHGSNGATSQVFLNAIQPRGAFISCGQRQFGLINHPEQNLIDRLHAHADIRHFYLTNCSYLTTHVPSSNGQNQLPAAGNKSRVAGENDVANLHAGRHRGNIRLDIGEAESNSNFIIGPLMLGQVLREYRVSYFDDDNTAAPFAPHASLGARVENTVF
jgi:hypothetical protein